MTFAEILAEKGAEAGLSFTPLQPLLRAAGGN